MDTSNTFWMFIMPPFLVMYIAIFFLTGPGVGYKLLAILLAAVSFGLYFSKINWPGGTY